MSGVELGLVSMFCCSFYSSSFIVPFPSPPYTADPKEQSKSSKSNYTSTPTPQPNSYSATQSSQTYTKTDQQYTVYAGYPPTRAHKNNQSTNMQYLLTYHHLIVCRYPIETMLSRLWIEAWVTLFEGVDEGDQAAFEETFCCGRDCTGEEDVAEVVEVDFGGQVCGVVADAAVDEGTC